MEERERDAQLKFCLLNVFNNAFTSRQSISKCLFYFYFFVMSASTISLWFNRREIYANMVYFACGHFSMQLIYIMLFCVFKIIFKFNGDNFLH